MPSLTDTLRSAAPGSIDEAAIISQLDAAACGAADGRGCRALHYLAWKLPSPLAELKVTPLGNVSRTTTLLAVLGEFEALVTVSRHVAVPPCTGGDPTSTGRGSDDAGGAASTGVIGAGGIDAGAGGESNGHTGGGGRGSESRAHSNSRGGSSGDGATGATHRPGA